MRVLFVVAPTKYQLPVGQHFEVGVEYDLPLDQANRWLSRGCAIEAPVKLKDVPVEAQVPAPKPAAVVPDVPAAVVPPVVAPADGAGTKVDAEAKAADDAGPTPPAAAVKVVKK